jgi:CheY-like chemotaxis protein
MGCLMKDNQILPGYESAGMPRLGWTNPPRRILLVEDDFFISQFIARMLTRFGYEVTVAHDGEAAWAALNDDKFDLLITDNNMPRLTGVELLRRLRAARIELPVILATGTLPADDFGRGPWPQPGATLLKPFTAAELLRTVERVLGETEDDPGSMQMLLFRDREDNQNFQAGASNGRLRQYPTKPACRILVVDDARGSRRLSVHVLTVSGYDVDAVNDGAAGWEALQAASYDLVITDNKMPGLTGIEMIGKLRAASMAIPVIMATRSIPAREFERKPWLKPDAQLQRPFSNDDLLQAVRKILNANQSREWIAPPPNQ